MVNATDFDGSTDYFLRGAGLTGAADGTVGLCSVWLNLDTVSGTQFILGDDNIRATLFMSSALIQLFLVSTTGTTLISVQSTGSFSVDSWIHSLLSWDTSANRVQIYRNDSDVTDTPITNISGTIDYTATDWAVGANAVGGTSKVNGCISELYFNSAETLDLSVAANRRKFITADLKAVDLGADGSNPTGNSPIIYLPNPFGSFGTNPGTGGNFTDQGSVAACADAPPAADVAGPAGDYILPLMRRRQRRA